MVILRILVGHSGSLHDVCGHILGFGSHPMKFYNNPIRFDSFPLKLGGHPIKFYGHCKKKEIRTIFF